MELNFGENSLGSNKKKTSNRETGIQTLNKLDSKEARGFWKWTNLKDKKENTLFAFFLVRLGIL